ncbi:hypothetical protein LPB140_06035 [Sphingorhabdus lutea]|uniref:Uncharacterized protein n=1 Tax=Sphingorhabdus lutea TaxID=1913578 RepID=A0A1L3JBA9_9SPHN|nr:hypothetical protein [Sphingorhabdus lutea]APG62427.1 hypothetical protein LPB140_06035 [Sphingorhabdus lutea]
MKKTLYIIGAAFLMAGTPITAQSEQINIEGAPEPVPAPANDDAKHVTCFITFAAELGNLEDKDTNPRTNGLSSLTSYYFGRLRERNSVEEIKAMFTQATFMKAVSNSAENSAMCKADAAKFGSEMKDLGSHITGLFK